ncbi:MAG: tetratricopeptide repeat protein [Leptospirillia bacterium]
MTPALFRWRVASAFLMVLAFGGALSLIAQEGETPASPAERIKILKQRAADSPKPDTWFHLGRLQFESGDPAEGFRSVARAISLAPAGHYAQTYFVHQLGKSEFKERVTLLEDLRKILPDYPPLLEQLGWLYLGKNKNAEAEKLLKHWVQIRPDNPEPHTRLAEFYRVSGRLEEAVAEFARVRELSGENSYALRRLGTLYRELGQLDRSAEVLTVAISLRADHAAAARRLGESYKSRGDAQQAGKMEAAATAVTRQTDDLRALIELGHTRMAQKRHTDAVDAFRTAAGLDPESPVFQVLLAGAEAGAGNMKAAEASYRKAVALDKFNLEAQLGLGELLLSQGDAKGALPHLREASSRNDRNPDMHFLVGRAALQAGDMKVAEYEYDKLKQIRSTTLAKELGELIKKQTAAP